MEKMPPTTKPRLAPLHLGAITATVLMIVFATLAFFRASLANTSNISTQVIVAASLPVVSAITVNNGSDIVLTANTTTTITVSFNLTDGNGCGDVFLNGNVTATLARSGVSSSCSLSTFNENALNCYMVATTTHNCTVATTTSANATATFQLYYFAQGTDASSSFSAQGWQAFVIARDAGNATGSASSSLVELTTLNAIHMTTSSINYGSVNANTDTGSTNQISTVKNAGNTSTTLNVAGSALTSGANLIPTSSQHYATTTFTYGGAEQALSASAAAVGGFGISRPPATQWTNTTVLPDRLYELGAATNGRYIYASGGRDSSFNPTSSVFYAAINATASVGSWSAATTLPANRREHMTAVINEYLYIIGGNSDAGGTTSSILYASINSTGSIGSWNNTTALPDAMLDRALATHQNYLYVTGGNVAGGTSTIWYTSSTGNGSLNSWLQTTPLPGPQRFHSAVAENGYLYVLGGITSTVYYAPINATGSLGTWRATDAVWPNESTVSEPAAVASEGIVYMAGGLISVSTTSVAFMPVRQNGSLGFESQTTALPWGLDDHAAVTHNGYMYVLGGWDQSNITSTVQFIPLASRNLYWGLAVPAGTAGGTFTGSNTFTAVFAP